MSDICFYNAHPYYGGLNNNGGSKTIAKSVIALLGIMHSPVIVTHVDKLKWFPHPAPVRKIPGDVRFVVAVSASDVKGVLKESPKKAKTAWWIRGWEKWQMEEGSLYKRARSIKCIVISSWLKEKLARHEIHSEVCYAGLDLNDWKMAPKDWSGKTRIGCLYNKSHKTKRWDLFERLSTVLDPEKYEFVGFGMNSPKDTSFLKEYLKNPSHNDLKKLYQSCHIWFAPTELEGFHQVAAEAALCGALIVCNNIPSNGMGDYCEYRTAMVYNNFNEAVDMIRHPDYDKVVHMNELLRTKIGDREKNMRRFVRLLNGTAN